MHKHKKLVQYKDYIKETVIKQESVAKILNLNQRFTSSESSSGSQVLIYYIKIRSNLNIKAFGKFISYLDRACLREQ
jgi:hypothetical protein